MSNDEKGGQLGGKSRNVVRMLEPIWNDTQLKIYLGAKEKVYGVKSQGLGTFK